MIRPHPRGSVRLNEPLGGASLGNGSRSRQHGPSTSTQAVHDRLANSPGAARYEDSLAREFIRVVGDVKRGHLEIVL